jgi:hypothetical protein
MGNQQYAYEFTRFEDEILHPFLANNPAISNWLDPVLLVITPAGPPPAELTNALKGIDTAAGGGKCGLVQSYCGY